MFNWLRWLFRTRPKKKYYDGIPIIWCRGLLLKDLRCHYTGRFCNPAKIKEHPCPVAQKYL